MDSSVAVRQWLQAADAALRGGDSVAAESALRGALCVAPDDPRALRVLAILRREQGDVAEARALLERALAANPRDAAVWNTLGNLLLASSAPDAAEQAFRSAAELEPNNPDPHYNLARTLWQGGRAAEAAASLERARALSARASAGMLQLQAQMEAAAGHVNAALQTLEHAVGTFPSAGPLHHERALALQRLHRHGEAIEAHDSAMALGVNAADAHYSRGNCLQALGRYEHAVSAYREAIARDPEHALAHHDLARLRWRLGDPVFDKDLLAAAARSVQPVLPSLLAHLYWRAERYADAAAQWQTAADRAPQNPAWHDGLGRALVRAGRGADGLAAHLRAIELAPHDGILHVHHSASLLCMGQYEPALAAAELACRLLPTDQQAQALRGLCWRLLGDPREPWLNDHERLVAVIDLPCPAGWSDMPSFAGALASELRTLHRDTRAPIDQTLRGGTQTLGNIFEQGHALVDAIKQPIADAVDAWLSALPDDAAHPFLGRRAEGGWAFDQAWSSRFVGNGFHVDHVHPCGWISACFYVSVPPSSADDGCRRGWLRLGKPDLPLPIDCEALVQREVQPRPGRLVLFPSYLWHGTRPFEEHGSERLTIAFDILPRRSDIAARHPPAVVE